MKCNAWDLINNALCNVPSLNYFTILRPMFCHSIFRTLFVGESVSTTTDWMESNFRTQNPQKRDSSMFGVDPVAPSIAHTRILKMNIACQDRILIFQTINCRSDSQMNNVEENPSKEANTMKVSQGIHCWLEYHKPHSKKTRSKPTSQSFPN